MAAITYQNTSTNIPNWPNNMHLDLPRGYAFETPTHFVHIYGSDTGINVISEGLTVTEAKNGTLNDWAVRVFGAQNIMQMNLPAGHSVDGVWRPSLYYSEVVHQALNFTDAEMRSSENALRSLLDKLDEIFLFIEPDAASLSTYSHKTRELLILACTEVENQWKFFMMRANAVPAGRNFTTNDYVLLVDKLHLKEFQFTLKTYDTIPAISPFSGWTNVAPTASLPWYEAYNRTKHDRQSHFSDASLRHCIHAVVASLILHCVRFGPMIAFNQNNAFTSLLNQHFDISLINSAYQTYYLPAVNFPGNLNNHLQVFDIRQSKYTIPYIVDPLVL